ncbi:hypothetical protein Tco_0907338 [Tanacetum coccineum]|uniref:Uncharacterized protein n=1 Tax=Tanacetum coccineum TaxID=301880 RepID=A0ABQ5CL84_9ASTR
MEESSPKMVDTYVKELTKTQVPIYVALGLIMERQQSQSDVAKMIADVILQERENLQAEISSQINNAITNHIPSQVDSSVRHYMLGHILHVHSTQASPAFAQEQQYQLYLTMKDNPQLQQDDLPIWFALKYKFERLHVSDTSCRPSTICPRYQDDPHENAHPKGENSAKRKKMSKHGTYVFGESSSGQENESEPGPSTSCNQEQLDDFDFWTDSYAIDDDELLTKKLSQELVEEMSQTVDEAKLRKVVNEMLRQRCTSGDEHQYHIDQMQNFLKNNIVWESKKEILVSPYLQKPTLVVQSCQRDPKDPALSLVNQDLLYLKKRNSRPKKIMMSLHNFPAIIFPNDDIEESTSRWVDKCVKRFNPYAGYSVEHWKNPHAKIFYIKKKKETEKPKEVVYSNSKIVQIIKTYWELGHEHKFITEIVARTVDDYAETGLLWSLFVFIRSTVILERVHDFQLVYDIIYKNKKKEKRVMRHQEHGYVTPSLSKEDAEYLQLFVEEIEERLKHRDQMRCWEMYMNGRPLGLRRERPE